MLSDKQLEANRANAQKSTGPRTPEGKKRSSLNALRHGLSAQVVILPGEDVEIFQKHEAAIVANLDPQGAAERTLAEVFAGCAWRIKRALNIEESLYTLGLIEGVAENLNIEDPAIHNAVTYAKVFREESETFNRLSLYTSRIANQAKSVLKELENLRTRREAAQHDDLCNATLIWKLQKMQDLEFNPQENGFVCTLPQIELYDRRRTLTANADIAASVNWDIRKYWQKTVARPD